jgi:GTP cyclohydrolase II
VSAARAVARAVDELRRGEPVLLTGAGAALAVLAVEAADEASLAAFDAEGASDVVVSHQRAAVLNLTNQIAAADAQPARIARAAWMDLGQSLATADPVRDLATPLKGPYATVPPGPLAGAGVRLAKLAGLLPAVFAAERALPGAVAVNGDAVLAYRPTDGLRLVTRARLPLADAEDTQVVAFRAAFGPEHLALIVGTPAKPPLVRLHSACLTGDVLGSMKCDCGPQLRGALARMRGEGGGILLYLQQEGRGIGLLNKLRAYALQDQGFDTVDANLRLGFEVDERDFGLAAAMLKALGQSQVRLLTNNPSKVSGLEATGIAVAERVPHDMGTNPHNEAYLATKRDRTGHLL